MMSYMIDDIYTDVPPVTKVKVNNRVHSYFVSRETLISFQNNTCTSS